uniref:Uncharacterized protein n=1 Tax=Meloidogyne incognita TaxID=6306 RepID=A0A914M855_MELIC
MTSENAGGSGSIPNVETIDDKKRIAQLEHEIFTVCKQLDEKKRKIERSSATECAS